MLLFVHLLHFFLTAFFEMLALLFQHAVLLSKLLVLQIKRIIFFSHGVQLIFYLFLLFLKKAHLWFKLLQLFFNFAFFSFDAFNDHILRLTLVIHFCFQLFNLKFKFLWFAFQLPINFFLGLYFFFCSLLNASQIFKLLFKFSGLIRILLLDLLNSPRNNILTILNHHTFPQFQTFRMLLELFPHFLLIFKSQHVIFFSQLILYFLALLLPSLANQKHVLLHLGYHLFVLTFFNFCFFLKHLGFVFKFFLFDSNLPF